MVRGSRNKNPMRESQPDNDGDHEEHYDGHIILPRPPVIIPEDQIGYLGRFRRDRLVRGASQLPSSVEKALKDGDVGENRQDNDNDGQVIENQADQHIRHTFDGSWLAPRTSRSGRNRPR